MRGTRLGGGGKGGIGVWEGVASTAGEAGGDGVAVPGLDVACPAAPGSGECGDGGAAEGVRDGLAA